MAALITMESSTRVTYNPLGQRRSTLCFTSRAVIRVGDPASRGGKVLDRCAQHFIMMASQ